MRAIAKYNPLDIADETLRAIYVGREHLLEELLERLRAQATGETTQHYLVYGPRGIGKTAFLKMLRLRLFESDASFHIVQLPEELPAVTSPARFWVAVIDALGKRLPSEPIPPEQRRALLRIRDRVNGGQKAFACLTDILETLDGRLVLLLENFDALLDEAFRTERETALLRDELMHEPNIIVVATSPALMGAVTNYSKPLFGLFDIHELEPLGADEMLRLLRNLAERIGSDEACERLETNEHTVKAIVTLTAKYPRLALLLFELVRQPDLLEVVDLFNALMDDLTPYYLGLLRDMSPKMREVFDGFIQRGGSASASELAETLVMPLNHVTAQLKRLRDQRWVHAEKRKLKPKSGKGRARTVYTVTDPVFRLWYQMRYDQQQREVNGAIVAFLALWYRSGHEASRTLAKAKHFLDTHPHPQTLASPAHARNCEMTIRFSLIYLTRDDRGSGFEMLDRALGSLPSLPDEERSSLLIFYFKELLRKNPAMAGAAYERVAEALGGAFTQQFAPVKHVADYLCDGDERRLVRLAPTVRTAVEAMLDELGSEPGKS